MANQKGRRRSVVKVRKDDVVRMRIPSDQKRALIEAAEQEGLELSAWLRRLALREAGIQRVRGLGRGTK